MAAKDKRITDLETASLRYEIALDLGLPKEIAARLQGKDRDEMVADAEKLLELLSPTKAPASRRPTEHLRGGGAAGHRSRLKPTSQSSANGCSVAERSAPPTAMSAACG